MKDLMNDYFYFTKRERNGMLLLIGLSLLILAVPPIIRNFRAVETYNFKEFHQVMAAATPEKFNKISNASKPPLDFAALNPQPMDPNTADKKAFLNLGLSPKLTNTLLNYRNSGVRFYNAESLKKVYGMTDVDYQKMLPYLLFESKPKPRKKDTPDPMVVSQPIPAKPTIIIKKPTQKFDPNTVLKENLLSFGLPEKIVDRMIKFRNAGGKFTAPEDLETVYGMKEAWVSQLLPWMEIKKQKRIDPEKVNLKKKETKKKENPITDLNTANFEDWQNLIGIGPYYADKIMSYREKLGGFISVDQIMETNGLPDSVKQSILPALRLSDIFRKLKINRLSTKEIATHPYITWKQADVIVKYRKNHGPFNSRTDLEKMLALTSEFIDRIEPYLDFTKGED